MSHTDRLHNDQKSVDQFCLPCLSTFGIQEGRKPYKCTGAKCNRLICGQCLQHIKIYNGPNRTYRCMYCLKDYKKDEFPAKNELLLRELLHEATIKYGVERTEQLLSTSCDVQDLIIDVECRRYHLRHLITSAQRFSGQQVLQSLVTSAQNLVDQLSEITEQIRGRDEGVPNIYKEAYRAIISKSNDPNDLGMIYVYLCEDLQFEVANAEEQRSFPMTIALISDWLHEQGLASKFEPKIPPLIRAMEEDLTNQISNPHMTPRVKIGLIGYINAGKSSLTKRLLGLSTLQDDWASPVSDSKSTYFPLHFDRKDPLIDPNHKNRQTLVTLVDIQGLDENRTSNHSETTAGNYLDEVRKADCDIYIVVFDKQLSEEQQSWVTEIEEKLGRECVLVRSKIDRDYLTKFKDYSKKAYLRVPEAERAVLAPKIMRQLRDDSTAGSRSVYLVACDYSPNSSDAERLLEDHSFFDLAELRNKLGTLARSNHSNRVYKLANQALFRVINTCFRRGYILNGTKYKAAAGFASLIPFGDQLPRFLAREGIREAFGIDDDLRADIRRRNLIIYDYKLQTSVFEDSVKMVDSQVNSEFDARVIIRAAGAGLAAAANVAGDIVKVAAPTATAVSSVARGLFTAATLGVGVVLSAGVSAWSAIDSGKHIFSYINRLCNDIIMVNDSLIASILYPEPAENVDNTH